MADQKIEIIWENDELLIVNKPAGIVTTREKQIDNRNIYLEDWIRKNRPNGLLREGIGHRLDKGTSGLVVVAKTELALINLKKQFKDRTVKKKYWALVEGDFPFEAEINMPIKRSDYGFDKFGVSEEGKQAITMIKIKEKYRKENKIYSLVEVGLKTGRTHQIRVHLSYLKWPIVGDKLYGSKTTLNRPFLHAGELSLNLPSTGERKIFRVELPVELLELLQTYEKID